jgi:5-methylthioadenosine/S-adenosylhomocysteine deaminase
MSKDTEKAAQNAPSSKTSSNSQDRKFPAPAISKGLSRRSLLATAAIGTVTAASLGLPELTGRKAMEAMAASPPPKTGKGQGNQSILLQNCFAVLSMEGEGSLYDLAGADILIQNGKIAAIGKSLGGAAGGRVVDCSTLIAMPGFITTHHHKYETPQRSADADGYIVFPIGGPGGFGGPADPEQQNAFWPYESYVNVQALWNQGLMTDKDGHVWDYGAPTQTPDDLYISHLVASLAELKSGITCSTDTSQSSHTPQHTDGMIKGLMASGQRNVYAYTGGVNRAGFGHTTDPNGYEYPGTFDATDWGVGRLRNQYFASEDQLVTLCLQIGPTPVTNVQTGTPEPYTGWELAKHWGTWIDSHNLANPSVATNPLASDPEIGPKMTQIHCNRWGDPASPTAQVGANNTGFPNPGNVAAWQAYYNNKSHVSIAVSIEMQMRHGRPPIQECLNVGILPSLSPDVDCNKNGADPFTMIREFFDLQRVLSSDLAFPVSDPGPLLAPQSVTCYQALQAMTWAGAAGSGLSGNHHPTSAKVGMLKPGYDADIVLLETHDLRIAPANNAPGTIVTMMDTSNVRHVMVQGDFKVWNYELVGWNVRDLVNKITKSRDDIIERINSGPAIALPGNNTPVNPYKPPFLTSCCFKKQNEIAPLYTLTP